VQKGVGYGGRGNTKKCVYCTVNQFGDMTPDEARNHPRAVQNNQPHKNVCVFCKCEKRLVSRRGVLRRDELIKKENCADCRKT
jgi:hypothetical protein